MSQQLKFDNQIIRELTSEADSKNKASHQVRQVHGAHFSFVKPTSVSNPELLHFSHDAAQSLALSKDAFANQELINLFAGNETTIATEHFANCYGGHQFGHWAGQLGDGRAISLGDVSVDKNIWELQLKGAGATPYSRAGDGRAVLRSSIREYIISEAMYYLGVPTTRALCLVNTGDLVVRDMFYDGNPEYEPGAIVTRMAPSFIRFGSFEIFASRKEYEPLKQLANFVLLHHVPEIDKTENFSTEDYEQWFALICEKTAKLIVEWHRVGFVHGVMNTDNMSILGLTLDYGPFSFLDAFDPSFTPNTSDRNGRYTFSQQASIGHWNLSALGMALQSLFSDNFDIKECLNTHYVNIFNQEYMNMMRNKLGLKDVTNNTFENLLNSLMQLFNKAEIDMTLFFTALKNIDVEQDNALNIRTLTESFYFSDVTKAIATALNQFLNDYKLAQNENMLSSDERIKIMEANNPVIIPRNYILQEIIQAAEEGELKPLEDFFNVIQSPYQSSHTNSQYAQKRPEWARHAAGCGALSCSS